MPENNLSRLLWEYEAVGKKCDTWTLQEALEGTVIVNTIYERNRSEGLAVKFMLMMALQVATVVS